MTKEEAIKFIESCNDDFCGFSVNVVSSKDIYANCNDETIKRFDNLSNNHKEEVLSKMADDLKNTYEEWTFLRHFNKIMISFKKSLDNFKRYVILSV